MAWGRGDSAAASNAPLPLPPTCNSTWSHFVRSCPPRPAHCCRRCHVFILSSPPCSAFFHTFTSYSSANSFSSYTMDSPLENAPSPAESVKKGRKRVRKFTSSDRALHRMIEKQRREDLNDRFLVSRTQATVLFASPLCYTCSRVVAASI